MALGIVRSHLLGEEGRTGAGTNIAQDVAGLDVITAETPCGREPSLDEGHIVVVPQFARHLFREIHRHPAVLHRKDLIAQLPGTHEQIVCHGIAAKQRPAVIGGLGLSVRPVVVHLRGLHQTFHRGKIFIRGTGGRGKGLPVRVVEEEQLGGFCHREDLHAAAAVKVALGAVTFNELRLLVRRQVLAQIHQKPHLINGIGRIGVGRKNVGQRGSPHLALGRIHHTGFQIIDAALALRLHPDVLFLAHRVVEGLHQLVEAFQLVAVVVGPDHDLGHLSCFLCAAAASAAHRQRHRAQQTDGSFRKFFHEALLLDRGFLSPAAAAAMHGPSCLLYHARRVTVSKSVSKSSQISVALAETPASSPGRAGAFCRLRPGTDPGRAFFLLH